MEREEQMLELFRVLDEDLQDAFLEIMRYAQHGWMRFNCDAPCSKGKGEDNGKG